MAFMVKILLINSEATPGLAALKLCKQDTALIWIYKKAALNIRRCLN